MGEKIVVGPINKGLRNDREPFNIDNDSFPTLINSYQWRGRIKRKRGTSLLGRLNLYIGVTDGSGNATITVYPSPSSGLSQFVIGTDIFTDPGGSSPVTLITNGTGSGSLNRSTGVLTITGSQISTAVYYYPQLPVMGIRDLSINAVQFPGTIAFDTDYAYNVSTAAPFNIYNVSFFKNPSTSGSYTQKGTWTPVNWNGKDYMQFTTANYQGAFWAANGINTPFDSTVVGMQYAPASTISFSSQTETTLVVIITNCPLVIGDFVFLNEWTSSTPANALALNFQSGYVTATSGTPSSLTVTIKLPNATLVSDTYSPGIIQYLTNVSDSTKDCIRWYDGDPTGGSPPTPSTSMGWVNYMPPLSQGNYSIDTDTAAQYYLVGARIIIPFKDRLLFIGPVIQTSAANSQIYLQDTVIFTENGTPYYTASFTGTITSATTVFHPLLVPTNEVASPLALWEDVPGYGGYIAAGYSQPILTATNNEDVLILGFTNRFARLVYTGNDLLPFNFFIINSELGSGSTFSAITVDRGSITIGNYGITLTTQIASQRIDLEIPDQVFQINYNNNGSQRVCAIRDYINEWIYFTYPSNSVTYNYPNQTLQYNYREDTWAIFNESYTCYGNFRESSGNTWANLPWSSWTAWNEPWDAGSDTVYMPKVAAGTTQGYIMLREQGTDEGVSISIQNISGSLVTAPNHCLNEGDYIVISGALGTVASSVNGKIFSVTSPSSTTFSLLPNVGSGLTYLGGGQIKRMYVPFVQTKQFPMAWGMARKTRIGVQQYLLSRTTNAQITLLIFLSQDSDNPFNNLEYPQSVQVVPSNSLNNALVYSTVLYTCPESTNLGLTPANINLQMVTASNQSQIWHRMNTSLIGDTVQIGFTMNDDQMRDTTFSNQFSEIELHGIILDVSPSMVLA